MAVEIFVLFIKFIFDQLQLQQLNYCQVMLVTFLPPLEASVSQNPPSLKEKITLLKAIDIRCQYFAYIFPGIS